jgi:hypothetical protein
MYMPDEVFHDWKLMRIKEEVPPPLPVPDLDKEIP